MKFNCGVKSVYLLPLVVGGLSFILLPILLRRSATPEPPPVVTPPGVPGEGAPLVATLPVPPAPASSAPQAPADPLLRRWQTSIRQHDAKGVMDAQTAFLAREDEYRGPLGEMAKGDPDPRIRAFCVAVLGRMKSPPAEEFFIGRLADESEHPRTSALSSLLRIGTAACLPAVDRAALSDPSEGVRSAAATAAKAVRSR